MWINGSKLNHIKNLGSPCNIELVLGNVYFFIFSFEGFKIFVYGIESLPKRMTC